jgi:hypothetical protein
MSRLQKTSAGHGRGSLKGERIQVLGGCAAPQKRVTVLALARGCAVVDGSINVATGLRCKCKLCSAQTELACKETQPGHRGDISITTKRKIWGAPSRTRASKCVDGTANADVVLYHDIGISKRRLHRSRWRPQYCKACSIKGGGGVRVHPHPFAKFGIMND